ncbi:MAG: alpha/beta fold hydrolase [Oscillospiraceae bacterium]|nr:alpha/beta fold hydrolase [Oscillospiraceae bacterium]
MPLAKHPFRRVLSLLSALCLLAAQAVPALAADKHCGCGKTPVILLHGYSGGQLFLDPGGPAREHVWSIPINGGNTKTLLEYALEALPKLLADADGNAEEMIERAGEAYDKLLEKLEMNEDGSSKYDLKPYPLTAEDSRWDRMAERGEERLNTQRAITRSFLDYIGADHVYIFNSDWRKSHIETAAWLDEYIQQVKAHSGHEKVSLFGVSYGGQLAVTYFTYYGDKGDVGRAVLHSPALRGSELAYDLLLNEDFIFDPVSLLELLTNVMNRETPSRLESLDLPAVSDIALRLLRRYFWPTVRRFGSYWDLIPPGFYAQLSREHLDPERNAEILWRADKMHSEVMSNISETLRRMQRQGLRLALICGTGHALASGNPVNSDYIIDLASTTGAAACPPGKAFPADYQPLQTVCADSAHRHISPDRGIDASSAYLPEHTWFFREQYHGQASWDDYARELYCKFLFTDEIEDIYSDPRYPQFRDSCNPSNALEARFSGSVSGYLRAEDEVLLLKNMSSHDISLNAVRARGLDLSIRFFKPILLRPGETARLRYSVILPQTEGSFTLTAEFVREGAVPSQERRSFSFTALPSSAEGLAFLDYPYEGVGLAPIHLRPARWLTLLLSLTLSLLLAGLALGIVLKRGLFQRGG